MSTTRNPQTQTGRTKRKYRSDGTPTWMKRNIDGPGIWVSCVKGKEIQAVKELLAVLEPMVPELWPEMDLLLTQDNEDDSADEDLDGDLEKQVANELEAIKKRPNRVKLLSKLPYTSRHGKQLSPTITEKMDCKLNSAVAFIASKPPVDPVKLVTSHVQNVYETGYSRTRFAQRLIPVAEACSANMPEIISMCGRVFRTFFQQFPDTKFRYKIDLRMRNHTTLTRLDIIQEIAKCVPEEHNVDLDDPEVFILVEVFKSICGVSVVKDYYHFMKFNVSELAKTRSEEMGRTANGRIGEDQ